MLTTLFYLPAEIATPWGTWPVFGAGLLLGAWLLFCFVLLVRLTWKQGLTRDTLGHLPVLGLIALAIWVVLPQLLEYDSASRPLGLPIRGYGVMLLLGIVCGVGLAVWRAGRVGIPSDTIHSLAMWMFLAGFAGARLFYVIEYWNQFQRPTWSETLVAAINVAQGGLVVYGSAIGAAAAFVWFARSRKLPALALADVVSPSLVVGLALGRIGCFLNGCCYGGLSALPWAVEFPAHSPPYVRQAERGQLYGIQLNGARGGDRGQRVVPVIGGMMPDSPAVAAGINVGDQVVRIDGQPVDALGEAQQLIARAVDEGRPLRITVGDEVLGPASHRSARLELLPEAKQRSLAVHPTQLYSTINAVVLLALLLAYEPFRRRDGELTALLFTLYPVTRFLLEQIRVDEPPLSTTGLSISQNISLLVLAAVACGWVWLLRQPPKLTWPGPVVPPPPRKNPGEPG